MGFPRNAREGFKPRSPELEDEVQRRIEEGQSVTFIMRDLVTNCRTIYDIMRDRGLVSAGVKTKLEARERLLKERRDKQLAAIEKKANKLVEREAKVLEKEKKKKLDQAKSFEVARLKEERRQKNAELRKQRKRDHNKAYRARKKAQRPEAPRESDPSSADLRSTDAHCSVCAYSWKRS